MIRAVLFDLDDTLVDREASIQACAVQLLRDLGDQLLIADAAQLAAELVRIDRNGYNRERAAEIAAHAMWRTPPSPQVVAARWNQYMGALAQARPGLLATIDALAAAGLRLGVVSNGPTKKQKHKIETLGIADKLGTLLISEEVGLAKPDERIFRRAASELEVDPSECLFVGDNPDKDVRAAAAVGMRAVWFPAKLAWPEALPAPRESVRALGEVLALVGVIC
jgi:putative hydrolase of the HAD superfamily